MVRATADDPCVQVTLDPFTNVELFKSLHCDEETKPLWQSLGEVTLSEAQNRIRENLVSAGFDYGVSLIPSNFSLPGSGGPSGDKQDNSEGNWLWDTSQLPKGSFIDPDSILKLYSDGSLFGVKQQPVDLTLETMVTQGSADGWSSGLLDGEFGERLRWSWSKNHGNPTYSPSKEVKEFLATRSGARLGQEPNFGFNYTSMSSEEWNQAIWGGERLADAVNHDVNPAMYGLGDAFDVVRTKVSDLTTTNRDEAGPAWQMVMESVNQSTLAHDGLSGRMQENQKVSFDWGKGLLSDAQAVGYGHPHEMAKVGVGISGVTDNYLALYAAMLRVAAFRMTRPSTSSPTPTPGPSVSYDKALDHYQRTSGETAENIAWMRANPDDEIATGPNKGWTFRKLMKDHVEKRGGKPGFAMGGVVPGPIGAPVPAILHGGERVLRGGQAGGGQVNVCLHVHGAVLSERELVRSVREGLIRLNREVTEMGF